MAQAVFFTSKREGSEILNFRTLRAHMMRIAFSLIVGHSRYPYRGAINFSDGMPTSSGTTIEDLLERYDYTGNKGNMIHGEAPARILRCNREESAYLNLGALYHSGWTPAKINKEVSSRFDLIVLSMANAIRPGFNPGRVLPAILEALECDFIVLGLGMQESMPRDTSKLHPNLLKLLNLCNRKAKIFAVRGRETENWLNAVGFENAIALGCPSLFVYPQNIMNLRPPDPAQVRTAVTAGYIGARVERAYAIVSLFENFNAHYVMQQEMSSLKEYFANTDGLYNEATGEINKELLDIVLEKIHDRRMPFLSYRWFQDPHAWRAFTSQADFYLGDRFHGGAVALQTGVPALIVAEDQRVREMTDFFKIPNTYIREIKRSNIKELLASRLSMENIEMLKSIYIQRFANFKKALQESGIELAVTIESQKSDVSTVSHKASTIPKPNILRRLVSKAKHRLVS